MCLTSAYPDPPPGLKAVEQASVMRELRDELMQTGADAGAAERARLEAQVRELTGGMGFEMHKKFQKAREQASCLQLLAPCLTLSPDWQALNAELEGECPVCFEEGGKHAAGCPHWQP